MKFTLLLLTFFISLRIAYPQTWSLLPNSPAASWRHDDVFFINADTGWVVNVDGYIYKTTDGGNSWDTLLYKPATSFRCIGFANHLKGWAGNLGPGSWSPTTDTLPLYETSDGGITWTPVMNINGTFPPGVCGISVVDDSVAYAVGRVGGPGYIMKTSDGGQSWTSSPVPQQIYYLIDCKFFSRDTGLVAGCTGSVNTERFGIFYTTDGGQTWQVVYNSPDFHGHCWKLTFPSRSTGYASVEAWPGMDSIPVLKTVDGGLTWTEKLFSSTYSWNQGIGFINDTTGWCGATTVRQTTDGGDTWGLFSFVGNFNRFRKVNDTLGYACGFRIWKYSSTGLSVPSMDVPQGFSLEQNFPNPFSDKTTIRYRIPFAGNVTLKVYDWAGRPVKTLVNEFQKSGSYSTEFSLPYFYETVFYYCLSLDGYLLTGSAIMSGH